MFDWKVSGGDLVFYWTGTDEEREMLRRSYLIAVGDATEDDFPEDAEILDFRTLGDMEYELAPEDLFQPYPEDVGALTSGQLFSDNCTFEPNDSEDPEDMSDCNLWWDSGYQTRSWIEVLIDKGEVTFESAAETKSTRRTKATKGSALADTYPLVDAYMNENAQLYLDMLDKGSSNNFYSSTGAVGLSQYLSDMRREGFPFPDSYNELAGLVDKLERTIHDTNYHLFEVGVLSTEGSSDKLTLIQDPDPEYPEFHDPEEVYEDDVQIEGSDMIPAAYWSGLDEIEGLVELVTEKWREVAEELEEIAETM